LIAHLRTLSADPEPLAGAPAAEPVAEPSPEPPAAAIEPPAAAVEPPAAAPEAPAAPAESAGLTPITFTEQQVAQGRSAFSSNCSSCHGEGGVGLDGPALVGDLFSHWFDDPVADLFNYTSITMPASDPGSL